MSKHQPLPPGCRRIALEPMLARIVGQHLDAVNAAQEQLVLVTNAALASARVAGRHQLLGVELDHKHDRAALIVKDVPKASKELKEPAP